MAIKLPAAIRHAVTRRTAARLQRISRFAIGQHVAIVPAQLRKPYNLRAWKNLSDDARLVHLAVRVRQQVVTEEIAKLRHAEADHAEREAARQRTHALAAAAKGTPALALASANFPTVAGTTNALAPGWHLVVPCAAGCGTFHPARSLRPVLVTCVREGNPAPGPAPVKEIEPLVAGTTCDGRQKVKRATQKKARSPRLSCGKTD